MIQLFLNSKLTNLFTILSKLSKILNWYFIKNFFFFDRRVTIVIFRKEINLGNLIIKWRIKESNLKIPNSNLFQKRVILSNKLYYSLMYAFPLISARRNFAMFVFKIDHSITLVLILADWNLFQNEIDFRGLFNFNYIHMYTYMYTYQLINLIELY